MHIVKYVGLQLLDLKMLTNFKLLIPKDADQTMMFFFTLIIINSAIFSCEVVKFK